MHASICGYIEIVNDLLDAAAEVDTLRDDLGRSALDMARERGNNRNEIVALLESRIASKRRTDTFPDQHPSLSHATTHNVSRDLQSSSSMCDHLLNCIFDTYHAYT